MGPLASVTIDGKSLVMVAPDGADLFVEPSLAGFTITNLAPGQNVSMRGFTLRNDSGITFVSVTSNQGLVWLEDIDGDSHYVDFQNTTAVLDRFTAPPLSTGFGTSTTGATGCELHVYDSVFQTPFVLAQSAHGGTGPPIAGPPALSLTDSFLFAYGTEITSTVDDLSLPDIIDLELLGTSEAFLVDAPASFIGTPPTFLPGVARSYFLDPAVVEGEVLNHTFTGQPGDRIFLWISTEPGARYVPRFGGSLVAGPQACPVKFVGVIPASGTVVVPVTVPLLPVGVEGLAFYTQAAFISSTGELSIAGGSMVVILDESV